MSLLPNIIAPNTPMDANKVQENFEALDGGVSNLSTTVDSVESGIASKLATMKTNIDTTIDNTKTELQTSINNVSKQIPSQTNILNYIMPNWSKKVNRGTDYTLTEDCWVYLVGTVGWANTSSSSKAGDVCIGGGLGRGDSWMTVGGIWIGAKGDHITGSFTIYTVPFVGRG